ncbi:MAG: hypothetical protein M3P33_00865 [bacterium]|nr:hypothetical protein [bacterium]
MQGTTLSKESRSSRPTKIKPRESIQIEAAFPLDYFDKLNLKLNEAQVQLLLARALFLGQFTQRSILAQSGAYLQLLSSNLSLIADTKKQNNQITAEFKFTNFSPTSTLIIPPQLNLGKLLIQPSPFEGLNLIQNAANVFDSHDNIFLVSHSGQSYPLSEALTWSANDPRLQSEEKIMILSIPILRSGFSTSRKIKLQQLKSDRRDLDRQLKIKWGQTALARYLKTPYTIISETSPVRLPSDCAINIITGTNSPYIIHIPSTLISPGFGATEYNTPEFKNIPTQEKGTRIRLEHVTYSGAFESQVWVHLLPA